jgi:hypothetical protein
MVKDKLILTWEEYYLLALKNFKEHGELRVDVNSDLYIWLNEQRQRSFFFTVEIDKLLAINFFEYRKLIESAENLKNKIDAENWSINEDQFLVDNAHLSIEKLANQLKRPTSAIRHRRQNLGILKKKKS